MPLLQIRFRVDSIVGMSPYDSLVQPMFDYGAATWGNVILLYPVSAKRAMMYHM